MGPPISSLTVDEERAAARARKFGIISTPLSPSAPNGTIVQVKPEPSTAPEPLQTPSPTMQSRNTSSPPAKSTRRSGSVESRASERFRRETQDRDARPRDPRGKETLPPREIGTSYRTSSDRKPSDEALDRRRQEDLLQARHEKLASEDKKLETPRSSRDGHRRETEKEREERKAKEREADREREKDRERTKDRAARESEEIGLKRKRDEVSFRC